MKKLLFSALLSLLFISVNQASVLPMLEHTAFGAPTECSSQISITFQTSASLDHLVLNNSQQVLFSDGNGDSLLATLSVNSSLSGANTLQVDFSSATDLHGWLAVTNQQLDFAHSVTSAAVTV